MEQQLLSKRTIASLLITLTCLVPPIHGFCVGTGWTSFLSKPTLLSISSKPIRKHFQNISLYAKNTDTGDETEDNEEPLKVDVVKGKIENDYMKEAELRERRAEIASLGGDPSFLTYDNLEEEDIEEQEDEANITPSFSLMAAIENAPTALDMITNSKEEKSSTSRDVNAGTGGVKDVSSGGDMHFMDDGDVTEFDLEEIGGDPAFLDLYDEKDSNSGDDFEWDGTVDENAHFDFY